MAGQVVRLGSFATSRRSTSTPGGRPLANGFQAADVAVLLGTATVLVAAGALVFSRRDVSV
jgi:hypothetical protein